jgi:hypothetical protein
LKRKYLPDNKLKKLVKEGFKTYALEVVKIFVNPVNWIKRGYTIREILMFWVCLFKNPKHVFTAIKWYTIVIFAKKVKKGQRL